MSVDERCDFLNHAVNFNREPLESSVADLSVAVSDTMENPTFKNCRRLNLTTMTALAAVTSASIDLGKVLIHNSKIFDRLSTLFDQSRELSHDCKAQTGLAITEAEQEKMLVGHRQRISERLERFREISEKVPSKPHLLDQISEAYKKLNWQIQIGVS